MINGVTQLVVLIAPDKLTAYRDLLDEPHLHPFTELKNLIAQQPKLLPDMPKAIEAAIRSGQPDVYLPDDTHWGASGQEIVADTVIAFLE